MVFVPDKEFIVHETAHWRVNHRLDTDYPGYLMVASTDLAAMSLSQLNGEALAELGPILANAVRILEDNLNPKHVYVGRYGHDKQCNVHFHVMPIYDWAIDLYYADKRYSILNQFNRDPNDDGIDAANMTLYIWREFAESLTPPKPQGPPREKVIETIRTEFARTHKP